MEDISDAFKNININIDTLNETNKINDEKINIEHNNLVNKDIIRLELILKKYNIESNKIQFIINDYKTSSPIKGSQCSVSGNNYEKQIYNIVKKCKITNSDKAFNTQLDTELGGSSIKNDIICNHMDISFGIEIKKSNTPDWMQCSLKYDTKINKWKPSKSKNPTGCTNIFARLIENLSLYNNEVPPFIEKSLTHEQWIDIKQKTDKWDDIYINIQYDTISDLYCNKDCKYIQISDYGLYHLGNDICNFDVPLFVIEQRLRIRIKVHSKKNKNGYCSLSITAACNPTNISYLTKSKYSLDNINKLPPNLIYSN
jgi:predicted small secreted protein